MKKLLDRQIRDISIIRHINYGVAKKV